MTGPGDPNDPRQDAWFGSDDDVDWPPQDLDSPGEPGADDPFSPSGGEQRPEGWGDENWGDEDWGGEPWPGQPPPEQAQPEQPTEPATPDQAPDNAPLEQQATSYEPEQEAPQYEPEPAQPYQAPPEQVPEQVPGEQHAPGYEPEQETPGYEPGPPEQPIGQEAPQYEPEPTPEQTPQYASDEQVSAQTPPEHTPDQEPDEVAPDENVAAEAGEVIEGDGMPIEQEPEVWDTRRLGDRRRPTTAEQAVPWLVGLVLALTGIVIVLLALIYTDANGGFAAVPTSSNPPTPSPSLAASHSLVPSPLASEVPTETAAPTPAPTYGTLEMLYLARPSAFGASELYRDDFSTSGSPTVVAKASLDIAHYAVAPDGTVMAAIVDGKLLAITPGKANRTLASDVSAVTFGADASTVYVVKITRGGTNDDATVYAIGFASGTTTTLTTINFPHPATEQRSQLNDARFFDEGGEDRLYATSDGNVVFWVSGVGQWRIDPVSGNTIEVARQPVLWSPDGTQQIVITESGLQSTLALVDSTGNTLSRVQVTGLLSHLRWSPSGKQVVFTLGVNASGGGVRQDLYVWDLVNGRKPTQLTSNGASFGAEWLGVAQFWQP